MPEYAIIYVSLGAYIRNANTQYLAFGSMAKMVTKLKCDNFSLLNFFFLFLFYFIFVVRCYFYFNYIPISVILVRCCENQSCHLRSKWHFSMNWTHIARFNDQYNFHLHVICTTINQNLLFFLLLMVFFFSLFSFQGFWSRNERPCWIPSSIAQAFPMSATIYHEPHKHRTNVTIKTNTFLDAYLNGAAKSFPEF